MNFHEQWRGGRGGRGGHGPPSETFQGGAKTIHGNLKNFAMTGPLSDQFKGMEQMEATGPFQDENSAWRPLLARTAPFILTQNTIFQVFRQRDFLLRNQKFSRAFGALTSYCAFSAVFEGCFPSTLGWILPWYLFIKVTDTVNNREDVREIRKFYG